ncbi:hypothetical protein [Streptomyces sp. NBC_00525]|uniref:hypothetical protein n=1 Tax=Streptomyces sp. NBC_00525 TaxID=2903660 RepID=UPI002E7FD4C8|nr:hypothetical protein [Streptomyces sp. NBC_00525]WUC97304.1 hypothetical protein OG710_28445 [Streptomyces sp. NBC_00525]
MKLDLVLKEVHRGENALALRLARLSSTHATDHEVHHVARDLAAWSRQHVRELADAAADHGVELSAEPKEESAAAAWLREKGGELVGRRPETGLLLLRDLRDTYLRAAAVSVDWELLAQTAQAARDQELLDLAGRCHPQTLRQERWANAMIKVVSPQVLTS